MRKPGVVFARFQILHLKQMEYILAAKMRCNKLYIGITHPDIMQYASTMTHDTHGIVRRDNPLTYIERFEMILRAMTEFGVKRDEFEIIPFPISQPDVLDQYTPKHAVYYLNVTTPWDAERMQVLENLNLKTEILWRKSEEERGINGNRIRALIVESGDWEQYVPKSVASYLKEERIDERIRELHYHFVEHPEE